MVEVGQGADGVQVGDIVEVCLGVDVGRGVHVGDVVEVGHGVDVGRGVQVGSVVDVVQGVSVGDDCIGTDTGTIVGTMATVGSDVADGATVVVSGDLVADAWMVAGRVGAWVAAGMGDGGTGVEVAG